MAGVTRIGIPKIEQEIKSLNNKNKTWLKGGIIAVSIFLGINLILFLLALIFGEEARVVTRAIMSFPLLAIYSAVSDQIVEESWLASLIFLLLNSLVYFSIGALIGVIAKSVKQKLKINHHNHLNPNSNHNHLNHNHNGSRK